jgi:hypothetical protein
VVVQREVLALPFCFSRAGSEGLGYVESLETHLRDCCGVVALVHHRLLPDVALQTCRRLLPRVWSVSNSGRVSSDLLGPPENPEDVYPVNSVGSNRSLISASVLSVAKVETELLGTCGREAGAGLRFPALRGFSRRHGTLDVARSTAPIQGSSIQINRPGPINPSSSLDLS